VSSPITSNRNSWKHIPARLDIGIAGLCVHRLLQIGIVGNGSIHTAAPAWLGLPFTDYFKSE